jgi:ABC-type transport system substrate-binding protein
MKASRRQFIILSATGLAAATAGQSFAADPMVAETDPQAVGLGYKADTTKVDQAKYPKHAATQKCGGCALFKGAAGAAAGGCQIFAGKQVSGNGWCSAFAPKA